ncbi:MAG: PhnD/SsuA/transferrin family substrate-binding protein [Actinobacteria bacterium]|uniref:Unannotated protein n=1 Tax=freshwater metagenome TaxID=449393 RepID=A0A6J6A2L0_9ZZZZ|nr:PhnD/SsuA/transferrin family substrate-binding protein [Actinomycetota bacterium]MSW76572.1 PhnD/SsuA/transferrin family substrate-binding protein [Actinomycetota bacterium]MSX56372.1 PhnD/SsuA/transferrin family substrate-binding protein [Actinomycetota bacterium]MSZ82460.1 PhnD/SsuA/transferrin family substrate-binding protein [Actinomycetota bacterium]MTB16361.1 PhnD/SsuA/transferrin family substrate-binding protein [Actinomycetota bacterium]
MGSPVASLAMYPFAHLRDATDRLWQAVRVRLDDGPHTLEWSVVTPEVWSHPDLLVAQTCGWPLATEYADRLCVIGAFDYDVPGAVDGTYCSVIITNDPNASLAELRARPGVVAAINSTDSLSGRVSLEHVWGGLSSVVSTGAHAESIRALVDGRADVASIDAVTWALIGDFDPTLVAGLRVIGAGPRVGCLPLVTRLARAADVPRFREAFTAAVSDPAIAAELRLMRIRGFVPKDLADYLPVRALVG